MDKLEALVICPILLGFGVSILSVIVLGFLALLNIIPERFIIFSLVPTGLGTVISLSVCGYGLITFAIDEFRELWKE